jgi:hypothetical protein
VTWNSSWFSPGTPVSSTNKSDGRDITEIREQYFSCINDENKITINKSGKKGGPWMKIKIATGNRE